METSGLLSVLMVDLELFSSLKGGIMSIDVSIVAVEVPVVESRLLAGRMELLLESSEGAPGTSTVVDVAISIA